MSSESDDEEDEVDERTAMIKDKATVVVQNQNLRKSAEKRKSGGSILSSK